jgi:endoglycosylceramidase
VRSSAAFLVLVVSCALLPAVSRADGPLRVDGRFIRDDAGGVILLRGVNTAGNSKVPPFRPVTGPSFFDPLRGWGMNVVRLLFTWEAYEPSPGVYDETYMEYYRAAVDGAASRGLHVIVDFHQDAFSRSLLSGCGDGFPAWAIPPWVIRNTPNNGHGCWHWGASMIWDVGMHMAWGAFHDDARGARTRYLQMVERVAGRLASHGGVIGYDMVNEPWGDEPTDLFELYELAAVAIRRAHPTAILFVSPHALISAGGGRSGLRKPTFGNFVYSPHFYDASVVVFKSWPGGTLETQYGHMRAVADGWGVPLFVGEFGATATTTNGPAYIRTNYERLDDALAGGAQWVFTPGWTPQAKDGWNGEDLSIALPDGTPRPTFSARPFPRRTAGTPTRFSAALAGAPGTRTVDLAWTHDPAAGSTELFLPADIVFGTRDITFTTTGAQLTCAAGGDLIRCSSPAAGPKTLRVTPAPPP